MRIGHGLLDLTGNDKALRPGSFGRVSSSRGTSMTTLITVDETSGVQNDQGGITSNDTDASLPLQFQDALAAEGAGGGSVNSVALSGVDGTVANSGGVNVMTFGAGVTDVAFTDGSGNPLDAVDSGLTTTDGTTIYLYTSSFNNNVVVGRAGLGGDVVFAVYLDTGVDTGTGDPGATGAKLWLVQFEAIGHTPNVGANDIEYLSGLLNVSVNTLSNFSLEGAPSGANLFMMFGDGSPDLDDVAIVATGWHPANQSEGEAINTGDTMIDSQGGGGTTLGTNNQMIDPGEGMYFSFVKGANPDYTVPNLDQNEADIEANIDFASYQGATSASFMLVQLQPPKAATVKLSAFDNTDASEVGVSYIDGLGDGDDVAVNIESVTITRMVKVGKDLVETTYTFSEGDNTPQGGLTLDFTGDTVTITGATAGDRIEYSTGAAEHNRLLVNNVGSGSGNMSASFDIGGFQLASGNIATTALDDLAFVDDAPSASIERTADTMPLDETQGAKAGDANADTDDIDGGNPDPFAGAYGAPIGALSGVDLVDTTSDMGADSDGATTTIALEIVNGDGSDSGLMTTDGTQIDLWMEADGTVTGRTGGAAGAVTFAISMADDGTVSVAQYASLQHPDAGSDDESVDLSGMLNAVVTATDGDGDMDTAAVDIGAAISFDDDGPAVSANGLVQLDDDALAGGNPGGTGDLDPDTANTSGTLGHDFGADGAGSVAYLTTGAPAGFSYEASGSSLLVKQGTTVVMTLTLNAATGAYTVTQNAAVMHAAGSDENDQSFTINYRVTDGDGDTADGTLVIDNVDDDTPVDFTPDSLTLTNTGTDSGTEDLNSGDKAGADGLGSLVFVDNYVADDYLYDSNTAALLTAGGENIVLSGWGTGTLLAQRETGGETVFTATIDTTTHQYTIDFDMTIDDGGGISFLGAAPVKSGNPTYNVIDNVAGTTLDLLFSGSDTDGGASADHSVNVSTTGAGTDNQSMNPGETLKIDFAVGASLAGSPNGSDFVLGTHQTVNGFSFLLSQNTPSGTTGTAYVQAVDADGDKVLVGDAGDVVDPITKVQVNGLTIYDNGVFTAQTINGHEVSAIFYNGGVVITGLNEGATGDGTGGDDPVIKVYTADGFNRIEVSNFAGETVAGQLMGGTSFDIAPGGIDLAVQGTSFAFELPVQLTDADGDSTAVELIGVTVDPVPI